MYSWSKRLIQDPKYQLLQGLDPPAQINVIVGSWIRRSEIYVAVVIYLDAPAFLSKEA